MRSVFFICILTFSLLSRAADNRFVFSPKLIEAYGHIMALRLDKGHELLKEEEKINPNNPALAFVSDYHFFIKSFINEDVKAFEHEIDAFKQRLSIIEKGDKSSPYYMYCQAELLLHQAALRFKFRDYIRGANDVRDSYKLLEANIKKFPDFKPHYKSKGMMEVLVGTVPPRYTWVTDLLGMQGNIEEGMKKIEDYRNAPYINEETEMLKEEALFMYAFLQLHIVKEKEEAWKDIEAATRDYQSNLLHCYARASVGMHCKKTDEVIKTLTNRPRSKEYAKFYFLEYMLGSAYLYKQDTLAQIHLKTFVAFFKGENYIKDAYRKLAWSYLCVGNEERYHIYMGLAIRNGKANVDEDKQALREAETSDIPQVDILRSRMYFDGGYYKQALAILDKLKTKNWERSHDAIEYPYRLARVYDESNQVDLAISYYAKTIASGKESPLYFAANAALHMGYIYEKKKNYPMARKYFNEAMNFPNEEFKSSINQKAKAGLERIKGK